MSIRFTPILLVPLVLLLTACPSRQDPLACQDACSHQQERSFCDIDGVYPGTELENECIAPPSPDACNRIESCTLEGKPYCTDDSMGVCVECLDGSHCGDGEVCNASGACIVLACTPGTAGDASCAAADPSLAFCGPDDSCVACLASADCSGGANAAVCDPVDFECRGCLANSECDSNVCGVDTGECVSEADILHVVDGADGTDCTLASPCGSINTALGLVTPTRKSVVVGAGDYSDPVVITDIAAVTIVGEEGANINPSLGATEAAVLVTGASNVRMEGIDIDLNGASTASSSIALKCAESAGGTPSLSFSQGTVSGSSGLGVEASSCSLSITQSTISSNPGGGIEVSGGDLTLTASTISGNTDGGIEVSGGDFNIVNNFIVNNGGLSSAVGGLAVVATSANSETLEFNTFARNQRGETSGTAIFCNVSNLVASNNILMLAEGSTLGLTNDSCSHTFSLFDSEASDAQTGDNNISDKASFVNPTSGNFRLQPGSPGIDAADPAATLETDVDGDPRPEGDARDMGADEAG